MNDHDLDDLVIDTEPLKSHTKTKNPLTLFALVIIILILGIVFNKNFHSENENPELLEENMNDFIAPELQLQNNESKTLSTLSVNDEETEMPSPESASKNDPSVEELIAKRTKTPLERMQVIEMPIPRQQRTATPETKPVKEALAKTIDESPKKEEKSPPKEREKKPEVQKVEKEVEKTVEKKTEIQPREIVKEVKEKPISRKVIQEAVEKEREQRTEQANGKNFYIQVGAFKNNPSKRLLSVITSTGFKYRITEPSRSGAKKLLIGPYPNRASVNKALVRVQTRINKSAYVVQK